MKIRVLEAATLGSDVSFGVLEAFGTLDIREKTGQMDVASSLRDTEIAIVNKAHIGEAELLDAGALRLICITATGFDNVDVAACRARGIGVCNVKGYSTASVAQFTLGLALELINHTRQYNDFVQSGEYVARGLPISSDPVFRELEGKTWGVVGLGAIGTRVGKIAAALGCRVIGYNRSGHGEFDVVPLSVLLCSSDVISLHLPLTDETRHLIDADALARMKKGAVLINVARGDVVDGEAVVSAISAGKLSGYASDVYPTEPPRADDPIYLLRSSPRVLLTPHAAWGALEARERCISEVGENIRSFLEGGFRCRVDL